MSAVPAHTVRRSARARRVSVRIDPRDGGVEVVLPQRAAAREAERALAELAPWIARQQAKAERARAAVERPEGTVPYLGGSLVLTPQPGRVRAHRRADDLFVPDDPEDQGAAVERWYRRQAKAEFVPRVEAAVRELDRTAPGRLRIPYSRTVIRDQRTRWGSCSHSGTISLNWRLMLAPDEVAEYVIVHEVCHLAEMNHSDRYWALVAALYPGYQQPRGWLKAHGAALRL